MRPKSLWQVLTETWWSSLKRAKCVLRLEILSGARRACIWTESKWTPKNTVCWEGERTLFLVLIQRPRSRMWRRNTSLWRFTDSLEWARMQHPCTLWMSSVPKPGQREEPCIGKPSLQKRTEQTSCAAEWPEYENRHLSGWQWQISLPLEYKT